MSFAPEEIAASQRACRLLTRRAGSNFPAAFCLLPPAKRRAMHALYAFMRHSDDLADDPPSGHSAAEVLRQWRGAFETALAGGSLAETTLAGKNSMGPVGRIANPSYEAAMAANWLAEIDTRGQAILPAVVQTVHEFQIPPQSLLAVLDGVEMDLQPRQYDTFDELAVYCERVASAVGLACIHIWGFFVGKMQEPDCQAELDGSVLQASRSAGLALQLTNILRDVREDAQRGRIYLPLEDLRDCGYTPEELRQGVVNRPFLRLMEMEIARAEQFYREAAELFRSLHRDGRRIYGLMMGTYHALLHAIRRCPADVFTRRIRVSRWKKVWLAARWSLLPVRSRAIVEQE